jgi:hypothetical protein
VKKNYNRVVPSPAVDKSVENLAVTVTSVKGSRGSSHGKTQVKSTATSATKASAHVNARTAVGPGRWFQIQLYI